MNVLKSIGMQGRLLPKYKGKYQAHPKGYWQNEFKIAKVLVFRIHNFYLIMRQQKKILL